MEKVSTGTQINALTATRAVAAIMVFIHHFGGAIFPFSRYPSFFKAGNIAVCYFFVLSGFVLYISYHPKRISYFDYLKRRIGRIVPVALLALILIIYLSVANAGYNLFTRRSEHEIFLGAFLLQSFVPTFPLTLNLPAWTISVEMFFYILFPLLLFVQKKSLRFFVLMTIILFALSQYFNLKYYPHRHELSDTITDTILFSPEIHLSQFLIGMIGGYIFTCIKNTSHKYRFLPLLLFSMVVFVVAFRPEKISYQVGLLDPLLMLLIIAIAISNPVALNVKPFVYLGEISYGIYILQWPVYCYLDYINSKYVHIPPAYFFYCALALLILAAAASYHLLELPLKKKIVAIPLPRIFQKASGYHK